jgi:cold shock CspA family protein
VQGVVRFFDPQTGEGVIISDTADRTEYSVAADALKGSIFVTLRQGQRVNFELNGAGRATSLRFGSEPDMGLPTAQV